MTREEMLVRHGYYCACAARDLGDISYFERWYGRADELTESVAMEIWREIRARLVAAGKCAPDEDPYPL